MQRGGQPDSASKMGGPMPQTDDEIREKYLERAIRELNALTRDLQALERLHQRAARAPVEGHALLDLGGAGGVLEQEDVRLRMARPQHGHEVAARAMLARLHLARERVQLADRALEVLLADLVVGRRHGREF